MEAADTPFLREMLREAAAGSPERPRSSLDELLAVPETARYVKGWGRAGDTGRIAEGPQEVPVGAAWYRLYSAAEPGYGFVSESVPEVSIAVSEGARKSGVGSALLAALSEDARRQGHPSLSLSVLRENPAVRLYERFGFRLVEVTGEHQTMRPRLLGGRTSATFHKGLIRPSCSS